MKSSDLSENASFVLYCQLAVLVLATLVTYSTGCLTCRLAGCLALAAAAFLHAVLQCACAQCLYVFHLYVLLHFFNFFYFSYFCNDFVFPGHLAKWKAPHIGYTFMDCTVCTARIPYSALLLWFRRRPTCCCHSSDSRWNSLDDEISSYWY